MSPIAPSTASSGSVAIVQPVVVTNPSSASGLQPFQCAICSKRFTRHMKENLKRHSALHSNSQASTSFPCFYCTTIFSRRDLRKRHIKKKHPDKPERSQSISSQTGEDVNGSAVMEPVNGSGIFDYSQVQVIGAPLLQSDGTTSNYDQNMASTHVSELSNIFGSMVGNSSNSGPALSVAELLSSCHNPGSYSALSNQSTQSMNQLPAPNSLSPVSLFAYGSPNNADILSSHNVQTGIHLFFTYISHFFSFIHRPTFDPSNVPELLLLAMLSVSMQYSDNPHEGSNIARSCFQRARKILEEEKSTHTSSLSHLYTLQACLMLEMHGMTISCGDDTIHGLRLHTRCIEMSRTGGLPEPYPSQAANSGDLEALWRQFARAEAHKRTFFAVYQSDATWYQILSMPRQMSHLEIKHELPCSADLWNAASATDWAHRTLVADKTRTSPKYIIAIRSCLTPTLANCMPAHDAYGFFLVIFFVLCSVREVSGWSTMTGRVCFERFEALHNSLKAMEPSLNFPPSDGPIATLTLAAWHMAMIELLLWSSPHTNGVVENSMDAAMAAATHLSVTQPIIMSPQVIEPLTTHLEWYLTYLDRTVDPSLEHPWLTVYAFKTALIAWQLIRAGHFDHVRNIGAPNEITGPRAMTEWIKMIFARRNRWGIGRLILKSLDELDAAS